jgi:tetratricopeptide (TPR) repeat protein
MKKLIAILIIVTVFILNFPGCQKGEVGKIAITTSSKEALEKFKKGRDLFERLQGQESLQYLNGAIETDPNFAMAHIFVSFSQPTIQGFFDHLYQAVALKETVSEGERLWIEGVKAGSDGYPIKQQEIYKKLVSKFPNDERAHNLLGNNFFGLQEYEKAIEAYQKVIAINPNFSQPYNQMGYAYRFLKKYDEAEKAFQKYVELIPNDPNPYDSYAELLMKTGRFEASIDKYQKALKVNPNFVASHIGIATNYNFLGKYEQARLQLENLFDIARNDGESRAAKFAMTISYLDEGNMDEALKELKWQFELGAKTNDALNMAGNLISMGNILYEDKNYDDAMKHYKKAYQAIYDSDHSEEVKANAKRTLLYNTARVAIAKKKVGEAKNKADELMKSAQSINNTFQTWLAHEVNGMIAMKEKKYDQAINSFHQANLQNPYNLYRLAEAYQAAGQSAAAEDYYAEAADHNTLNSMQYAFVRHKAAEKLGTM